MVSLVHSNATLESNPKDNAVAPDRTAVSVCNFVSDWLKWMPGDGTYRAEYGQYRPAGSTPVVRFMVFVLLDASDIPCSVTNTAYL